MTFSHHFDAVHNTMREAVAAGVFPGAVLRVSLGNEILFEHSYGFRDLFSRRPATLDTVYDLASLTKPLATTLVVMRLVAQERLHLDMACGEVVADLASTDKAGITIRHLLSHRSGLPAWRPYFHQLLRYREVDRLRQIRNMIVREPIQALPGATSLYSDIGFMLLQWILEEASGQALDRLVAESVYRPMQYRNLYFTTGDPIDISLPVAATELCPRRGRLLVGEVHDDNAHALGGMGGHAGLFGNAEGVHRLLDDLLAADRRVRKHPLFAADLIQLFWQRNGDGTWALGFDTPSDQSSSSGSHFSKKSVGHLGFTGTSFWVDRQRAAIVVLLTNRVHPCRYNTAIRSFRPALHDCVVSALDASN